MRILTSLLFVPFLLPIQALHAQSMLGGRSESTSSATHEVHQRPFDLNPKLGILSCDTRAGEGQSSATAGFAIDWNASQVLSSPFSSSFYYGTATGLSYAGTSSGPDDSALLMVPINARAGYRFTDQILAAAHGGLKLLYQNDPQVMNVGNGTHNLELFPNLGLDGSYSVSSYLAITAELDWILTDRSDPFIASIGVALPIG